VLIIVHAHKFDTNKPEINIHQKMAIYTAVPDELTLSDQSSRSLQEKPFKNDEPLGFAEAQQSLEITLEYSIENGLGERNRRRNILAKSYHTINSIPRRCRVMIGLVLLLGFILIVSVSAVVSRQEISQQSSSMSEANKARERLSDPSDSRFSNNGRGEGGGAGNTQSQSSDEFVSYQSSTQFVQSQNNNVFLGNDVRFPPFSVLDPVRDMDRYDYDRPESSVPSARLDPLIDQNKRALPTNAWYQNMLRLDADEEPSIDHRVYTVPYMIDAAGDFAGIRAHATRLETTPLQVGLNIDEPYGLTLGAMTDVINNVAATKLDKGYSVHEATDLGITLHWNSYMKATLVRGSPYVTMIYDMSNRAVSEGVLPTMQWELDTSELPIVDGSKTIDCPSEPVFTVERDIELAFFNSNQRWMLFFSRPVRLQCQNIPGRPTIFQVSEEETNDEDPLLIIRGALVVSSFNAGDDKDTFRENYANQLRASADVYPGQGTAVAHSFDENIDIARISFDWDAQSMREGNSNSVDDANEMIMFALPHHREILDGKISPTLCTTSILGPVCLVEGNVWNMYEKLPAVDFRATRHPNPKYMQILAEALVNDIRYQIPSNFQSGAADTYFSGKTIAKLARILLITEEMKELCASNNDYKTVCNGLDLPREEEIEEALNQLRDSVTVWVRSNTKAPFVYDNAWGGLVNCGCLYNAGECTNVFPECPAFTDQGLNFGNGFYNDHHFHYGYHVYAAAALAHFDSAWAVELYEDIALLVRDYANPSQDDAAFPVFRNKDWYRGHSWAGGITKPMFRNIMNQESSSEAIMAYEAIALFGKTMVPIFEESGDSDKAYRAEMMHKIGLTLTATEIRSTQKYWQVQQNSQDSEKIYPEGYTASVVGILWETFAQFTTWFGNAPYLIYGIQLLPITPIAEARDGLEWANEIYGPLSQSCNGACISEGWSVQVNAILATIGRVQEAVDNVLSIPSTAYEHAGGNGHSKSNTIWYISTRPGAYNPSFQSDEDKPISTAEDDEFTSENKETSESEDGEEFESVSGDEEDFESNVTNGGNPEQNLDDFRIDSEEDDFFEDFIADGVSDEKVQVDERSDSNDNNIFDEIIGGNEGSFNSNSNKVPNVEEDNVESGIIIGSGDDITGSSDNIDLNINNDDNSGVATAVLTCFNPNGCTDEILDSLAEGYTCRERIEYLMDVLGKLEVDACKQVAVDEYPAQCGFCRPNP